MTVEELKALKIKKVEITPDRYVNWVNAEMEDGTTGKLFSYCPDELTFSPEEFIGLTIDESIELRQKKDVAYLQS